MRKRHEMLPSRAMGRNVHVWCYGHWGMPVIVFPSAAGFAHEWDAHGMIDTLSEFLYRGKIKLYCPESNVSQTWTNKEGDINERMRLHHLYEHFVIKELIPWIQRDCASDSIRMAAMGCSLGGFYAANFSLKYPELFKYALCMSGRYDVTNFTNGVTTPDVYLNNPLAYVSGLQGDALARVAQNTHLALVCGQGRWEEGCIEETIALGRLLRAKGISNECDIWGLDSAHQWPWWKRQAMYHIGKAFN